MTCYALLVLLALPACQRTEPNEIDIRMRAMTAAELAPSTSDLDRAEHIRSAYDALARLAFARVRDRDVATLFEGSYRKAFYTFDVASIGFAATLLADMQHRGIATDEHYRKMHEAFMGARMFDEARALAKQHPVPKLEPVPELRSAALALGHPTVLVVDTTASVLTRESIDLRPAQVVVISHPRCHFSANAMRDIDKDPVLRDAFVSHATWVAPQHDNLELNAIQQWNREHPTMQHVIAYRSDEWPMFDYWGTPTFYFLRDGVVRAKVQGWPKEGSMAELREALHQIDSP